MAQKPANMSKVYDVRKEPDESPAAYLERLQETFQRYTPYDPEAEGSARTVMFTCVTQAAPDTKEKLQSLDRLEGKNLRDLVAVAEKVYNKRETAEQKGKKEREDRKEALPKF